LYLPQGPLKYQGLSLHQLRDVPEIAATNAQSTVVEVHYRLDAKHRYPTAVHDVLFAYDWVVKEFYSNDDDSIWLGQKDDKKAIPKLGVFGESFGASLAAMLALTECRQTGPAVTAAACHNAVYDWVSIAQTDSEHGQGDDIENKDLDLDSALFNLFRSISDWFDPFCSPTLFFRTVGINVPEIRSLKYFAKSNKVTFADRKKHIQHLLCTAPLRHDIRSVIESGNEEMSHALPIARKSSRKWPNIGSGLSMPDLLISSPKTGHLHEQADEIIRLVRQSMLRIDDHKAADLTLAMLKARERASHMIYDGKVKSWDEKDVVYMARWFKEVFSHDK